MAKLPPLIKYRRRFFRYGPCQAIVAQFKHGPKRCGDVAIFKVKSYDTDEDMPVCESHWLDYQDLKESEGAK